MTSFDVIRRLKKIFPGVKLGHLGTLDPMARGVLPVACGKATKVIEFIPDDYKIYRATMVLGGVSDTQDAWGQISFQPVAGFNPRDLDSIIKKYVGIIEQIPPMYSAVHHNGKRLYELARQGKNVKREARQVEVKLLKVISSEYDHLDQPRVIFEVECSKGTYVRTLCHDLGQELGTGAFLSDLQRLRSGAFTLKTAFTLDELDQRRANSNQYLCKIDFPLQSLGQLIVDSEDQATRIRHGNIVLVPGVASVGVVRVYHPLGQLLAIAELEKKNSQTRLRPLKVLV